MIYIDRNSLEPPVDVKLSKLSRETLVVIVPLCFLSLCNSISYRGGSNGLWQEQSICGGQESLCSSSH